MTAKTALKNIHLAAACVVSLIFCQQLIADNSLQLQPKLCIKKKASDFCDMTINIKWQAKQTNDHCVLNTTVNKQIACWENSSAGTASEKAHTKVDLIYTLLNEENDKVLDAQTFSVLSMKDDSQNSSRRRRHIWSLF